MTAPRNTEISGHDPKDVLERALMAIHGIADVLNAVGQCRDIVMRRTGCHISGANSKRLTRKPKRPSRKSATPSGRRNRDPPLGPMAAAGAVRCNPSHGAEDGVGLRIRRANCPWHGEPHCEGGAGPTPGNRRVHVMRSTGEAERKEAGRWLKARRESLGLTQREVARSVGFDYITMVSQIEAGKARVPPTRYVEYARVLKLSPQEFVKELIRYHDPEAHKILFSVEGERAARRGLAVVPPNDNGDAA
jgi:transcriptional regulator with XRE-family HTH domain